jgi:hypothetical protein
MPNATRVEIRGQGSNKTELSCRSSQNIFITTPLRSGHWTVRNVTMRGARSTAVRINNAGHLDFVGVSFLANTGGEGGAIFLGESDKRRRTSADLTLSTLTFDDYYCRWRCQFGVDRLLFLREPR